MSASDAAQGGENLRQAPPRRGENAANANESQRVAGETRGGIAAVAACRAYFASGALGLAGCAGAAGLAGPAGAGTGAGALWTGCGVSSVSVVG